MYTHTHTHTHTRTHTHTHTHTHTRQIMKKLQELGLGYLEEESARIDRLLNTNLSDDKTNQLTRRRYIISDFIERANKLKRE